MAMPVPLIFLFDPSEQKQKDIFLPASLAFPGTEALELFRLSDHLTYRLRGTVKVL